MPSQSEGKRRLATQDAPVKRYRVSRACDQCRTAREKCDGREPTCMPCAETKRACTFTSNPRKRGLQPGYIRSLETTLAFIFQKNPEVEALVNKHLAQENSILLARGTKESNQLHKSWRKSKFCRDITKALAGEQISCNDDRIPSSDEESEVDVEDASLLRMVPSNQPQEEMNWLPDTGHIPQIMPAPPLLGQPGPGPQQSLSSSELTPLPTNYWNLLELYSSYTQCWLPMCEKLDILKLSYSYPEQGLPLSYDMSGSGHHAEMWSIFAVGSIQDQYNATGSLDDQHAISSTRFYDISRLLIPDEVGNFDLNHVKALLNLAVFNINRSLLNAAWILVGAASKIFLTLDESTEIVSSRRTKVLASCFLLDNFLSLHLQRKPYLEKADLAWTGKIEEDGMEEWQPWGGELNSGTVTQSRLPTLALSSFNNLLELVDILVSTTQQSTARNFLHEMIGRLEIWKSSLPPKLDYIRSDSTSTPSTPPAMLLQLTYFTTAFALVPSQAWLQRILELLDILRAQLGFVKLPVIFVCLLQSVKRSSNSLTLDRTTSTRLRKHFTEFDHVRSITSGAESQNVPIAFTIASPEDRMRNAEMIQTSPQSFSSHMGEPVSGQYQLRNGPSSLLDDLLPDMNHNRHSSLQSNPFDMAPQTSALDPSAFDPNDPYNAFVSGDLESFFDELASVHGAKKLQNQPQFMQNLGFSSEASMADLLAADPSRFMPLPTDLGPENNSGSTHFPLNTFYDAG